MRRLMQTTMALPSMAASRLSKCSTRSLGDSLMRFSDPTTASSCAHFDLSFSLRLDLFALGRLLELGIDVRALGLESSSLASRLS
jgi:hypothetical protein